MSVQRDGARIDGKVRRRGQPDLKTTALVRRAAGLDVAVHQAHQTLHDHQPDAGALHARTFGAEAVEGFKQMRQLRLGHPDAGVLRFDHHAVTIAPTAQGHGPAGVVVLDGVDQQVDEDLAQTHPVCPHHQVGAHLCGVQGDLVAPRQLRDHLQGVVGHVAAVLSGDAEWQTAGFDARQVQHIPQHRQQVLPRLFNQTHMAALGVAEHGAGVHQQQLGKANHGIERGAQLMAHAREKIALGAVGPFCRFGRDHRIGIQLLLGDVGCVAKPRHAAVGFGRGHGLACQPSHALAGQQHPVLV